MTIKKFYETYLPSPFVPQGNGEIHFTPWGLWGPSYVIDNPATEQKLRRVRRYYGIAMTGVLLIGLFFLPVSFAWSNVLLGLMALYTLGVLRAVRHLRRIPRSLSFMQALEHHCSQIPWVVLIIAVIYCVLLVDGYARLILYSFEYPGIIAFDLRDLEKLLAAIPILILFLYALGCKLRASKAIKQKQK